MSKEKDTFCDPQLTHDQQAVRWFLLLEKRKLNGLERREFEAWRADAAHAAAFARANVLWGAVDEIVGCPEILRLCERVRARAKRRRLFGSAVVAASVAIVVIGGIALSGRLKPDIDAALVALSLRRAPAEGIFMTSIGERSTVTLRDGSVLTLDTDSSAQVAFSNRERTIRLARGQAMFEVAKGEPRPFVVYAGDRRIVATGTAFDVRLDEYAVEVTLVEGHVQVDHAPNLLQQASQFGLSTELKAGERLVARTGVGVSISPANIERVVSWTSGKLIFLDARLADAVKEVNRYTITPISLSDEKHVDFRVNGVFRAGQPAEFARAVALIHPVTIDYKPDGQIRIAVID